MVIELDNGSVIGSGHGCFIAAEIGINHNGSLSLAKEMIDAAKRCGVDGVKFQNYSVEDFLLNKEIDYVYQSQSEEVRESQFEMFQRYELSSEKLGDLKAYCDSLDLCFFSTPTGQAGLQDLIDLNVPLLKNGSDFLTNLDLIERMGASGIPTVLSTGMATLGEIDDAVRAFELGGGRDLILLVCTSSYPTPPDQIHLNRMQSLRDAFGCSVGFSDHSKGAVAGIAAGVLGACFIEKHFTTDSSLQGPDHWFSSTPEEMKFLVDSVRQAESALGESRIAPAESEMVGRKNYRLSCVAAEDLKAGTVIAGNHVSFSRPGDGIMPKLKESLVGVTLNRNVVRGEQFLWSDFHAG